jgi:hypothetical protein
MTGAAIDSTWHKSSTLFGPSAISWGTGEVNKAAGV